MSNTRITDLTFISDIADADVFVIDDVSELVTHKLDIANLSVAITGGISANLSNTSNTVANILTGTVNLSSVSFVDSNTSSVSLSGIGASPTDIFSFDSNDYRAAELLILVSDSEYSISKILLIHDDVDCYITEYGAVGSSNTELTSIDANIVNGLVNVTASGGSGNKKISVLANYLLK